MISVGGPSLREIFCLPDYKYVKISDSGSGTEVTVWTPASGNSICIGGILVSVTAIGTVELKDNTNGNIIAVLYFGVKEAIPLSMGFIFILLKDHTLNAKFTVDGSVGDCHITVFGREE